MSVSGVLGAEDEFHGSVAYHSVEATGVEKGVIARLLGISCNTVKCYWHSQAPPKYQRRALGKGLDPLATKIEEMGQQPFIGSRIFAELIKLG